MKPTAPRLARPSSGLEDASRDWLRRGIVGVLLAASIGLVYWSYQRLMPVQQRSSELSAATTRLISDLAALESRYAPDEIERIGARHAATQQLLFTSTDALPEWFEALKQQLLPLALDLKADFGRVTTHRAAAESVTVVPATLAVDIRPVAGLNVGQSPYQRVLRLLQILAAQPQRVDLVELTVTGGFNSISRGTLVLDLWAGDLPEAPLQ